MRKMIKELAIAVLIFSLIFGTVYAVTHLISNILYYQTQIIPPTEVPILMTKTGDIPSTILYETPYTFVITTENLDENYAYLCDTYMEIYADGGETLFPEDITVHYRDATPWEGDLTFTWDDGKKALVSAISGWTAGVDYSMEATITTTFHSSALATAYTAKVYIKGDIVLPP